MPLSNDLSALIGFGCEAVLYGINATLFFVSIIIVAQKRHQTHLTHPVVLLNCSIFLCCTTHFTLEFYHFKTYITKSGLNGFARETKYLVGADLLTSVTDVLGGIVLMYRCWLLYEKNLFVIIVPCLAALGGLACIAGATHFVVSENFGTIPPHTIAPLVLAGYSLPLCTNVLVTSLVIYRIWYMSFPLPGSPQIVAQTTSHRAMMLVIESGALYLFIQLVYVVVFALASPAKPLISVVAIQIYGIAPSLIVVSVGLGTSSEQFSDSLLSTWAVRHGYPSEATGL